MEIKIDPGYDDRTVGDVTDRGPGTEFWLQHLDTAERLAIRLTPQNRMWVVDIIAKLAHWLAEEGQQNEG